MKRSELEKKWKNSVRQLIAILVFGLIILAFSTGQKIWHHETVLWLEVIKACVVWLGVGGAIYVFGLIIKSIIVQGCREE